MSAYERVRASARRELGAERFAAAWAEGAAMTSDEAVALALGRPAEADDRPARAHFQIRLARAE